MPKFLRRFFRYFSVGGSTFAFDLLLLFLLIDVAHVQYLVATGVSFLIALTTNYVFSRKFVFRGTLRSVHSGYGIFLLIAFSGLAIVEFTMYQLVGQYQWNYLVARIVVGAFAGLWNYFLNLYVNFRVAGKPIE